MIATLILTVATSFTASPIAAVSPPASARGVDVRKSFVDAHAKSDRDACVELFLAHPAEALQVIDADLEGAMRIAEAAPAPDTKKMADMRARALWGAEVAAETLESPMILDYTASFVGWDAAQSARFRAGQAAYSKAMKAVEAGDAKAGLESARKVLENASPLGDWWGTAMGFDAVAAAQVKLGDKEHALEATANARMIYRNLGRQGDEYAQLLRMAKLCQELGRHARGRAACDGALSLAQSLDDLEGLKQLHALRDEFAKALTAPK